MSLRARLLVFFVGIVMIPMLVVAGVLFSLVRTEERGETEARLDVAQQAAIGLFEDDRSRAAAAGELIGADPRLARALRASDREALRRRLSELSTRTRAVRARLVHPGGAPIDVGSRDAIAPATTRLLDQGGNGEAAAGTLTVSVVAAGDYVALLERVTGLGAAVWTRGRPLASSIEGVGANAPEPGTDAEIAGEQFATAGFSGPAFDGGEVAVRVLADADQVRGNAAQLALIVGLGLVGFLALAFAFWWSVARTLRAETTRLLDATRRIGRGEFGVQVPAEGHDEFAALGRQFNSMSQQLEARLDDLVRERARVQSALRRVGESMARNLDRSALLETVVQTAVDGAGATGGRATMRVETNGHFDQVAAWGSLAGSAGAAVERAEAEVLATPSRPRLAEVSMGGANALSHALRARDETSQVLGLLSIARPDRPFSDAERELFVYLSTQASVSIENVDLHESMQRQAVTDDLTGLFNHRHFQEVMSSEVERARRFHTQVALVMLDIDDFKLVNDTHGHLQGDEVLRAVARVLRESAREIDEPARYGGEELAVALPQTDLDGAYQFAERLRGRIAALEVPLVEGEGVISVTASCGVAALRSSGASDKDTLVAAADRALYEAKRAGKNRTVKAQ